MGKRIIPSRGKGPRKWTCEGCGKQAFRSRKEARNYGRNLHHDHSLVGYECPKFEGHFHYGHNNHGRDCYRNSSH